MNGLRTSFRKIPLPALFLVLLAASFCGCGFNRLDPLLPDELEGLTLTDIRAIQQDSSLNLDQRRQAIRDAIGAPETPEGDRLVNFLLNLNIQ